MKGNEGRIALLTAALTYMASPLDFIPDWVPLAGFVDDAAVLALVFQLSRVDLNACRRWKKGRCREEGLKDAADA